jgi:ATP-dependent Clp protease ATP-binding subunit ClpC
MIAPTIIVAPIIAVSSIWCQQPSVASPFGGAMFERFTDRARRVIVLAQEEARTLDHNYIGTEHLLLGLLREDRGMAALVLESLGVSLESARRQVEEMIGRGQQAPSGHIPFTPRAKNVLKLSLAEALRLGHNYIGTEHLLLGLLREADGVAVQALAVLGVDLNQVGPRIAALLSEYREAHLSGAKEESRAEGEGRAEEESRAEEEGRAEGEGGSESPGGGGRPGGEGAGEA